MAIWRCAVSRLPLRWKADDACAYRGSRARVVRVYRETLIIRLASGSEVIALLDEVDLPPLPFEEVG